MERPAWLPFAVVALAACAVHLPTLGFGFVFDDEHLVVNNAFLRQDWSPAAAFRHHFWHGTPFETSYYRPVTVASLALNGRLLGWSAPAFHLVNVLLHAANATLLLALARRLGARRMPATCAAALFAVHPAAAWPVASIVARVDLLPALFILLAWLSAVKSPGDGEPGRKERSGSPSAASPWWSAALAGVCFLLALLSKESAIAFAAVLWLGLRRLWRPVVTTLASLAVYVALRSAAGIPLLPGRQVIDPSTNPLGVLQMPERLWSALELSGRYLVYLILPIRFSDRRDYVSGPLPGAASFGVLLAAALLLGSVLAVLFLWLRRSPLALPLGFALLGFLPASNLLVPIGSLYAQNFLYLPLLGLSLAAGLALDRAGLPHRGGGAGNRRAAQMAGPALLLLALVSVREASIWRDATTLFSTWTRRFPRYALAHSRLGVARLGAGETALAEEALRTALSLDNRMVEAHYNLGVCLARSGRGRPAIEEALVETEAALALAPGLAQARVNASGLLLQLGRSVEAETQAGAALEIAPDLVPARRNHAEALFQQERFDEAAESFGALAHASPDDPSVRSPHVVALLRSGQIDAARAAATQARQDFPSLAWFDFCLARVEIRSGKQRQALELLEISLDKDPATRDWLARVDDFASLDGQPRFEAIRRPPEPSR